MSTRKAGTWGSCHSTPFSWLLTRTERNATALRLARHATRSGGSWPSFSDDDVVQWCVEEACLEAFDLFEAGVKAELAERAAATAAVNEAQAQARRELEQMKA